MSTSTTKRVHTKKPTTVPGLDLKTATMQDVFDFVVFKLIQQGRPSLQGINCRYRAPQADGSVLKCGIGQIIPDELYVPAFECHVVSDLVSGGNAHGIVFPGAKAKTSFSRLIKGWVEAAGTGPFAEERREFLRSLQKAHDIGSYNPAADWLGFFRDAARVVAANYGLDASIVSYREARS